VRQEGKYDPDTNEPIVFELRYSFGRSGADLRKRITSVDWRDFRAYVGPLRPGWALRPGIPSRSLAVAFALAFVAIPLMSFRDSGLDIPVFLAWLTIFGLCMGLEGSNTRDYLTPTRLVQRYGILGRGRKEVPLSSIERVEFDYSGLWPAGEAQRLGDLRIFCPGETITIAGVPDPEAAAQAILNVKNGKPPGG
jgi:PH (Pleckstrin Homology) domain-containing protein